MQERQKASPPTGAWQLQQRSTAPSGGRVVGLGWSLLIETVRGPSPTYTLARLPTPPHTKNGWRFLSRAFGTQPPAPSPFEIWLRRWGGAMAGRSSPLAPFPTPTVRRFGPTPQRKCHNRRSSP